MGPLPPLFFDPDWYLTVYPDVAAAGRDPLRHYLRHGRREGRRPCALAAADRERDLRLGLLAAGPAALEPLLEGHGAAERAWAAIALARWQADRGDWAGAAVRLAPLDPWHDIVAGFALPDPALLGIETALTTGDTARAERIRHLARRAFGATPDLALAGANLAAAADGFGAGWRARLAPAFWRRGLPGLAVAPGSGPAFDRLRAARPRGLRPRSGPLVSVILPARDAGATIGAALAGLSAQSWRTLEILVMDNGSTDATAEVVRRHAAADPRIRLIDARGEPGAYPARNAGLAAARGDFVTTHDADDWSHPAKIAMQVAALRRRPAASASLSHWVRATPDLRFTRWWGSAGLVHRNVSSLMLRRKTVEQMGYWDRVRVGADSEYLERIEALCGPGAVIDAAPGLPLAVGRRTEDSLSRRGETGIDSQLAGIRRDYRMAARDWHAGAAAAGGLPLPRHPARRPFAAPSAMAFDDPPPAAPSPAERIRQSGLFDAAFVLQANPDLRRTDTDPARHHLDHGAAEGRDPGPDFSTTGYLLDHDPGGAAPVLHHLARRDGPVLPDLPGDLPAPEGAPRALFVGHRAEAHVFGAERSLLDMLDRANEAGIVPVTVLPRAGAGRYLAAVRARSHAVHIRPLPWRQGGIAPPARSVAHLVGLLRRWEAVELHQNTLVLDAPAAAARTAGVPLVVHVRELPGEDAQLCHDLGLAPEELRALTVAEADLLVANSEAVARWLAAPDKTLIRPNPVGATLFALPHAPTDPPRAALIGALEPRKGLADVLALARAVPEVQIRLIGPGGPSLDALRPLPGNVLHAGYAEGAAAALAQCDMVLSLSRFAESFGRTVAEAMAAGRPVLCWDRGTPPDLVGRDGAAGRVVPAGDLAAAALALREMTAPGTLAAMGVAARARARARAEAARALPEAALHPGLAGR